MALLREIKKYEPQNVTSSEQWTGGLCHSSLMLNLLSQSGMWQLEDLSTLLFMKATVHPWTFGFLMLKYAFPHIPATF